MLFTLFICEPGQFIKVFCEENLTKELKQKKKKKKQRTKTRNKNKTKNKEQNKNKKTNKQKHKQKTKTKTKSRLTCLHISKCYTSQPGQIQVQIGN